MSTDSTAPQREIAAAESQAAEHDATCAEALARSACLARYRSPRPPVAALGLSSRQAAEISRIHARCGRTTWAARDDGNVLVVVHGDHPQSADTPVYLVMRADGSIVRAGGRLRSTPVAAVV